MSETPEHSITIFCRSKSGSIISEILRYLDSQRICYELCDRCFSPETNHTRLVQETGTNITPAAIIDGKAYSEPEKILPALQELKGVSANGI